MKKQIEEMARDLCDCLPVVCCDYASSVNKDDCKTCVKNDIAEYLYNAGYRKQREITEEIFAEIEKILIATYNSIQVGCHNYMRYGNPDSPLAMIEHGKLRGVRQIINEIIIFEKKYTEATDEKAD